LSELAALVEDLLRKDKRGSSRSSRSSSNSSRNINDDDDGAGRRRPLLLPACDELMQRPDSVFRDGTFLTSHATPVHWAPRADGSRQLELRDVCRLKRYTSTEANRCLAGKHLSMIGDSLTRYLHLSLAFLLERGTFPPRFRRPPAPQQPCRHVDEAGRPSCSSYGDATPNICVEFEWGSWDEYYGSLGGGGPAINGSTGGVLNGRMECRSHRPSGQGETNDNTLYVNGGSRATLSFAFEVGWGDVPKPLRGYYFSNCSSEGSCRRTFQDAATIANRTRHGDYDWEQTFPEAIDRNGTLRTVLPTPPDYAIYNRGVWGQLPEARARRIMPLLKDWVSGGAGDGDSGPGDGSGTRGRCFFRSTTAHYQSLSHGHLRNEHLKVRPHAHRAGCSYLDYAHLTEPFAALDWDEHLHHPASTERKSVFVDAVRTSEFGPSPVDPIDLSNGALAPCLTRSWLGASSMMMRSSYSRSAPSLVIFGQVHFQPWVYEELNQMLLNVLCNDKKLEA
jgi:hypothetical protein